jgi:FAD/FMN-containing dehydrogenase
VDDGVVIDHGLRRGVELSADRTQVSVEPGALLGDLDAATVPHGVAVPIGINTTTGLAGLTLGGGIGWLMRAHGLTCDRLVGAEVVLADGSLVQVDEATQPDLLWALRGGGGNFGIVTRFEFATVPMPEAVLAGMLAFPLEDGVRVLRAYRDWTAESPNSLTTIVALRTVLPLPALPVEVHGRRMVGIGVCFVGDPPDDDALLAPLRALGTPLYDSVARKPFTVHQEMFDASVPPRNGYYWKSHFLAGLTDGAIETAVDHHLRAPQPWSYSLLGQLGGATAQVATDATAYPHREAPFFININGVDDDPAHDDEVIAWTRETFDALAPFSTGGVYVNFVGNEGDERVRAAYGPAYERLARIKARYDPDNVFSTNQNVRPAALAG